MDRPTLQAPKRLSALACAFTRNGIPKTEPFCVRCGRPVDMAFFSYAPPVHFGRQDTNSDYVDFQAAICIVQCHGQRFFWSSILGKIWHGDLVWMAPAQQNYANDNYTKLLG